ncbi:hypothetical protein Avbf_10225 [Armadillidium vulgare]|nr:hypothetical protein Avbf_10225 [Armadillidium vulgare]
MVSISSLVNRLIIDGVIQPVNLPDPCVMNLPPCELQPDDAFIHNPALNPDPSFVVQDNAPSSFNIEAPSPGILTDTFYGVPSPSMLNNTGPSSLSSTFDSDCTIDVDADYSLL